jgi:hypothetical protein
MNLTALFGYVWAATGNTMDKSADRTTASRGFIEILLHCFLQA